MTTSPLPSPLTIFMCGKRLVCFSCGRPARASCTAEGCARDLCVDHARKVGGDYRCAKHAPMTTNHSMPKPLCAKYGADDED